MVRIAHSNGRQILVVNPIFLSNNVGLDKGSGPSFAALWADRIPPLLRRKFRLTMYTFWIVFVSLTDSLLALFSSIFEISGIVIWPQHNHLPAFFLEFSDILVAKFRAPLKT